MILNNLLSNAIRYRKGIGQHIIRVRVVEDSAKRIALYIEDNGRGIDEEHQAHVFEMFYRGDVKTKGSGLGLYIAKEAAMRLNASLTFLVNEEKGCTFCLQLPGQPE